MLLNKDSLRNSTKEQKKTQKQQIEGPMKIDSLLFVDRPL